MKKDFQNKNIENNEELKNNVLKLLLQLYTYKDISEIVGISAEKIRQIAKILEKEEKWSFRKEVETKEKIYQMLVEGKTSEEINKETHVKLSVIKMFEDRINKTKNKKGKDTDKSKKTKKKEKEVKYIATSKEEIEEILKQIKRALIENEPTSQIIEYAKSLPYYWAKKIHKVLVKEMIKCGKKTEEIEKETGLGIELINKYIENLAESKQNSQNDSKKGRKAREINFDDNEEYIEEYDEESNIELDDGRDIIEVEARQNETMIYKIIKKLKENKESKEDFEMIRKIVDTNNIDIEIVDELICELLKSRKINRLLAAMYCNNCFLADESIEGYPKKRMEKLKKEIEEKFKLLNSEILKKSKMGLPISEISSIYGADEKYIHQLRGLDEFVL